MELLKKREEEKQKKLEKMAEKLNDSFKNDEEKYNDDTANTVTSQAATVKESEVQVEVKKEEPKSEMKPRALGMNEYKKFKFIEKIEAKYTIGDYLGQGAFGKVCKCILNDTGN